MSNVNMGKNEITQRVLEIAFFDKNPLFSAAEYGRWREATPGAMGRRGDLGDCSSVPHSPEELVR